jgi:hypothetical protein
MSIDIGANATSALRISVARKFLCKETCLDDYLPASMSAKTSFAIWKAAFAAGTPQ